MPVVVVGKWRRQQLPPPSFVDAIRCFQPPPPLPYWHWLGNYCRRMRNLGDVDGNAGRDSCRPCCVYPPPLRCRNDVDGAAD